MPIDAKREAHAALIEAATQMVRGDLLPRSGRISHREFHRLEEQHKRLGIAVRDAADAMRQEAPDAE